MEIKTRLFRDIGGTPQGVTGENRGPGSRVAGDPPGSGGPSSDTLTLTPAAQQLLQTARQAGPAPVDGARVAALREAIAEGRYQVEAGRIAERLFDLERKL